MGNKSEAIGWMRKAYELNPFDLSGAASYGYALVFSGNYQEGAVVLQRAVDTSTVHPCWWDYSLFLARFMTGEIDKASQAADALSIQKKWQYVAAQLVAAHAQGDEERAGELVAQLVSSYPKFAANPEAAFQDDNYPPELALKFVDALRAAGIGEAG
jgi:predicted Zn-dependent protease